MLLLADGSTIGGFDVAADPSSMTKRPSIGRTECVILEPEGHCYSYLSSQTLATASSVQRFTCASAPSAHIPLLRRVLAFRNMHIVDRPVYLHQHHLLPSALQWHAGDSPREHPITVRWRRGTFQLSRMERPDGLRVQSLDGMASVTLMTQSTHYFRASFLAPVDYHSSGQHKTTGRALFTRVHQYFTPHNVPAAFRYPAEVLVLAMAARNDCRKSLDCFGTPSCPTPSSDSYVVTALPTNSAFGARPNWTHFRPSRTSLPLSPADLYSFCKRRSVSCDESIASTNVFPHDVRVEWTKSATFIAVPFRGTVCVHVHADDSSIEYSRSGFFVHRRGDQDHCYTVDAMPMRSPFRRLDDACNVVDICLRAKRLCETMTTDRKDAPTTSPNNDMAPHAIVEDQENEMGVFRAFSDGRVRVVFRDRTILSMDAQAKFCSLFLSSGDTVTMSAASPSPEYLRYVVAAQSFQGWAFRTPPERAAYVRKLQHQHDLVDNELRRTRQFVRDFTKIDDRDMAVLQTYPRGSIQDVLHATAAHIQRVDAALKANDQAIFGGVK
ncbi:hypothetical protein H310_10157 [Aphanomyces invadans]|uniref:C5orf34-like C-terminal domain-containing protein n=1 Tax=Aphanomyces invadans TaxID=157072 RepID=A0A024TTC9_9STRA|nr:hypothetical protein H310_10157 [Aphanomyces invadans]ETV96881.1 hypothetical protein H310_10157 [Aphanomyces invadans]|eukprot:XP_008874658.1 hypothetical protein H310_10157 [Aphanomyces invadans]